MVLATPEWQGSRRLERRRRASIKVVGEVRHTTPDPDGVRFAGVEFVEIGDLERALLQRLIQDLKQPEHRSA